jgi:hypothetical protein
MPEGTGNEAQVRIIAEQLFEVWKTEQARIAKERGRWFGSNIAGWVSVTVVVIGTVAAGFGTYNLALDASARSIKNESAIATIKADTGDRLARIETKLDLIIGGESNLRESVR